MSHIVGYSNYLLRTSDNQLINVSYAAPAAPLLSSLIFERESGGEYRFTLPNKNWFPLCITIGFGEAYGERTYYWYNDRYVDIDNQSHTARLYSSNGEELLICFSKDFPRSPGLYTGSHWVQILSQLNATPLLLTSSDGTLAYNHQLFPGLIKEHDQSYFNEELGGYIHIKFAYENQERGTDSMWCKYTNFNNGTGTSIVDNTTTSIDLNSCFGRAQFYCSDSNDNIYELGDVVAYTGCWGSNSDKLLLTDGNSNILKTSTYPLSVQPSFTTNTYQIPRPLMPYQGKLVPIYIELANNTKLAYFDDSGFHCDNSAVSINGDRITVSAASLVTKMICIYTNLYSDWGWSDN